MSYILIISCAYELPTLEEVEKARDLILKDEPNTYIKISEVEK